MTFPYNGWSSNETTDLQNCSLAPIVPGVSMKRAVFFGIPATAIIVITIVGNFLVLCFRARVGKRQTTLLIWNLGLADFLVGVLVLPMGVTSIISRRWPFGWFLCRVWASCDVIFCTASIVTLCVISVDRYIGVTKPLRYKVIVTKRRVSIAIVVIWVFAISILLATVKYTDSTGCNDPNVCLVSNELRYVVHSVISAFFFPATITLGLYYKIFRVAKRRERGLREGIMMITKDTNFLHCFEPLRVHRGNTKASDRVAAQKKIIRMHKKASLTLGVVVFAFLLCWCPFFVFYLLHHNCKCVPLLLLDVLSWLGYCNSMVNPIIYAFTVQEFSRTIRLILHGPVAGMVAVFRTSTKCHQMSASFLCGQRDNLGLNKDRSRNQQGDSMQTKRVQSTGNDYGAFAKQKQRSFSASRVSKTIKENWFFQSSSEDEDSVKDDFTVKKSNRPICYTNNNSVSDFSSSQEIWSAKLYTTLIDSKVTGL